MISDLRWFEDIVEGSPWTVEDDYISDENYEKSQKNKIPKTPNLKLRTRRSERNEIKTPSQLSVRLGREQRRITSCWKIVN